MASFKEKNKMISNNKLRTRLLILENNELTRIKKTSLTQINSKNLIEYEKIISDLNNNNTIELKQENFCSRAFTDIISRNNIKEKFIMKSPDENNIKFKQNIENGLNDKLLLNQNNLDNKKILEEKYLVFLENLGLGNDGNNVKEEDTSKFMRRDKATIGTKKNLFFKLKTINYDVNSKTVDENSETKTVSKSSNN